MVAEELVDQETARRVSDYRRKTEDDLDYIRNKLRSHRDLVLARWTKKSKSKRLDLLRDVFDPIFPTIPLSDRSRQYKSHSIQLAWLRLSRMAGDRLKRDRLKLIALLHVRTEYSSSAWATFDTREAFIAYDTNVAHTIFNAHGVQMMGSRYGELVEWDANLAHAWCIAGAPRALLTLQIQSNLMNDLRQVVDGIVGEAVGTGCEKWSALVSAHFRHCRGEAAFDIYFEQAFLPPLSFSPLCLCAEATARLDYVLDELELMRSDPKYMHHIIKEMKACMLYNAKTEVFNHLAGAVFLVEVTSHLSMWTTLFDDRREVLRLFDHHKT